MSAKTDMEAKDMYYEALKVRHALLLHRWWVSHLPPVLTGPLSATALSAPPPQGVGQKNDKTAPPAPGSHFTHPVS